MKNKTSLLIPISDTMLEEAIKYGKKCLPYEYDRFGLDANKRLQKIIIGTLGELVFKQYLIDNNIFDITEFNLVVGQYDDCDFIIVDKKLDVKTSGFESSFEKLNLLYAVKPFHRRQYDYVIKVFVDGYEFHSKNYNFQNVKNGYLVGFIKYSEISNYPKFNFGYSEDYVVPISQLKNISILFSELLDHS